MKFSKAKPKHDGEPQIDIAFLSLATSHVSIDRPHGVIRRGKTTDSAAHEGARLREGLIDLANTASEVWAGSAYRSAANERFLDKAGKVRRLARRENCAGAPHHLRER